jgi:hypothetical protein
MKPHPRIRTAIKWGGAPLTLLLLAVWIGSEWWFVIRTPAGVLLSIGGGTINIARYRGTGKEGWKEGLNPRPRAPFRFGCWVDRGVVEIPIWPFAAAIGYMTWRTWRTDAVTRRRSRLNLCSTCGYERGGLAMDAKCPECGSAAA